MEEQDSRSLVIKKASWIGIVGNGFLAALKVGAGLIAGSLAVVGDGIDSTSDIISSLVSLFAAIIISRPPDREHPYGHFRAETVATVVLAFIMFFVGAELLRSSVVGIVRGSVRTSPAPLAMYVTIVSIAGKLAMTLYFRIAGTRINSTMLIANGKNLQNDILISTAVLIGLIFIKLFDTAVIDSILAILISLWIMFTAVRIFVEILTELMDGEKNQNLYTSVFQAVQETQGAARPHRARIRKLASLYVIDLDIEVDGTTTVIQAHDIAMEVEHQIREKIDNVYDIMVHVEPKGNVEEQEKYGRSEQDSY